MEAPLAGRVVVGISATLAGYQALRYAATEARQRGAPLVAVRVFKPANTVTGAMWRDTAVEAAHAEVARAFTNALGGIPLDLPVNVHLRSGVPAKKLVATADRAEDLLVIGASGRHPAARLRRAAAAYCARFAACPVVVVPAPALAGAGRRRLGRAVTRQAEQLLRSARPASDFTGRP